MNVEQRAGRSWKDGATSRPVAQVIGAQPLGRPGTKRAKGDAREIPGALTLLVAWVRAGVSHQHTGARVVLGPG